MGSHSTSYNTVDEGFMASGNAHTGVFYNRFSIKYVTKFVINAGNISLQIGK